MEDFDDDWPRFRESAMTYYRIPSLETVLTGHHRSGLPSNRGKDLLSSPP